MSKTYVIQWKSKVNGRAGRGTKLFELEEAEQLVSELNSEYPDIHHEVIDLGPQAEQAIAQAEESSTQHQEQEEQRPSPTPKPAYSVE